MYRIAVIEPRDQKIIYKTVPDKEISRAAGIDLLMHLIVQHDDNGRYGFFSRGVRPLLLPEYYALNRQLCHGVGVLYAFDPEGRTMNMPRHHPRPIWLGSFEHAVLAVEAGSVDRPGWG